ncbi:hypothetical protein KDH_78820 [Dictyobacter sp. S3.2.2.5]|uniref:histidine kinase n=2 Tax=Dictyobacter halimunensis TaxID=3026934 RepID=A0ABQ6G8A3_9CHLR|nr:hypothetical protein KDH_78820 [Dictyobacter sp. S3.2.2.5]
MGYPITLLLAAGAFLIGWFESRLGLSHVFLTPPFVIVTLLAGGIWGIGPALLALGIEVLALDYWVVPPLGNITFFLWPNILSYGQFLIIQLVALWVVIRQKRYRDQLFLANQAISRHVEELQEINWQLERASDARDRFVTQASHELRTPLTGVRGLAQLTLRRLLREPPLPTNYSFLPTNLEKIETQTQRLHTLVDDLLSINYLHTGNVPLRRKECDLMHLCRDVISYFEPMTDQEIELKKCSDQTVIQADEDRLSQVLYNLIRNALQYSPPHTTVRVEVYSNEREALLGVHNDGSFIAPEHQEHLFEPFYRDPNIWNSAITGWGLGLTISKYLVEQQKGRIWVESSEHQGTTFWIALPSGSSGGQGKETME